MNRLFVYRKEIVLSTQTLKEIRSAGYVPVRVNSLSNYQIVETDPNQWLMEFLLSELLSTTTVGAIREHLGVEIMKRQKLKLLKLKTI